MKPILLILAISLLALAGCKKDEQETRNIKYQVLCVDCPSNTSVKYSYIQLENGNFVDKYETSKSNIESIITKDFTTPFPLKNALAVYTEADTMGPSSYIMVRIFMDYQIVHWAINQPGKKHAQAIILP